MANICGNFNLFTVTMVAPRSTAPTSLNHFSLSSVHTLFVLAWPFQTNLISWEEFLNSPMLFKHTIFSPDDKFYITMPPYHLQWFWRHWLQIKIKDSKHFQNVLQACNGIQGKKPAGQNWCIALDIVLTDFVIGNVPCKQALYVLDQ